MLGKHHSEESKQKISMSKRGKKINVSSDDRDRRRKQITAYNKERDMSGKNNPMYGHSCTDFMTQDEIAKWKSNIGKSVSKRLLGKKHSDVHKLINSLSHQGKLLWNNGKEYRHSKECPGPEWQRGRIKKKTSEINPTFLLSTYCRCSFKQYAAILLEKLDAEKCITSEKISTSV